MGGIAQDHRSTFGQNLGPVARHFMPEKAPKPGILDLIQPAADPR